MNCEYSEMDGILKGLKGNSNLKKFIIKSKCFCFSTRGSIAYVSLSGYVDDYDIDYEFFNNPKIQTNSYYKMYVYIKNYLHHIGYHSIYCCINDFVPYETADESGCKKIIYFKDKDKIDGGNFACCERKILSFLVDNETKPIMYKYNAEAKLLKFYCKYLPCDRCTPFLTTNATQFYYLLESSKEAIDDTTFYHSVII